MGQGTRGRNGPGHGVRYVVILQVEKDLRAEASDLSHRLGASCSEEMDVDFQKPDEIGKKTGCVQRLIQTLDVEGYD